MIATVDLLDASVWVALAARDHDHHARALQFWEEERAAEAAFCRVTALAFIRLVMNPAVMQAGTLSASEAWDHYQEWRRLADTSFLLEPPGIEMALGNLLCVAVHGYRGVTDAYLAAFARTAGCRFVSFDRDFSRFDGLDFLHLEP